MSALQYFDLFDEVLLHHAQGFATIAGKKYGSKTLLFMDLMAFRGKLQRELLYFLSWLISNNDREVYFSGQCNIRFIHVQSNLELLKVTIFSNSRCVVHRRLNEWTGRVLINWQRNCERRKMEKDKNCQDDELSIVNQVSENEKAYQKMSFANEREQAEFVAMTYNKYSGSLEPSTESGTYDASMQLSSDSSGEQTTVYNDDSSIPKTLEWEEEKYPPQPPSSNSISNSTINRASVRPLVNDVYEMLVAMEAKVVNIRRMYSQAIVSDDLSSLRLLQEIRALTAEESEGRRASERLEQTIFHMNQQIRDIQQSNESEEYRLEPSDSAVSLRSIADNEPYEWDIVQFHKATATESNTVSQDATSADSAGSSLCSGEEGCGIVVPTIIPFHKSKSSLSFETQPFDVRKNKSLPELSALLESSNSGGMMSTRSMKEHPFFLNQAPALKGGSGSGEAYDSNYHYIMNRVRSSDSLSSLGNTSIDIQDSQAAYNMDHDNETTISEHLPPSLSHSADLILKPFVAKKKSLNIDLSSLPTASKDLCKTFQITLLSVFDGELVAKKSSTDFMYKKRYLWINPATRSIHWAKSLLNKEKSKFYMLTRTRVGQRPVGHIKGVVHSVEFGPKGIVICTENAQYLELKLPPQSVKDWEKVFLALI